MMVGFDVVFDNDLDDYIPDDTTTTTIPSTICGISGEILSILDMEIDTKNRWLVEGLVRKNTVAVMDGMGSTGKSYLATQLAIAITGGWPWLGFPTRAGKVIYINAEDPREEAWLRIQKIAANYDRQKIREALRNIRYFFVDDLLKAMPSTVLIDHNMQPTPFYYEIQNFCLEWRPDLIVLDPLGRFIEKENDNAYAAQLYTQIQRWDTTVLFVHHCNKMSMSQKNDEDMDDRGKSRGASNWVEMAKTRLYVRNGEIRVDKCNYNYQMQGKRIQLQFAGDMCYAVDVEDDEDIEETNAYTSKKRRGRPRKGGEEYADIEPF